MDEPTHRRTSKVPAESVWERYAPLGELGSGGLGRVLRARDRLLDRTVAVKVLHRTHLADPALRARFLREARLHARVLHPNLVRILEVYEGREPALVLEYIPGCTLGHAAGKVAPLSPGRTLDLARDIAGALAAIHQEGILHRDLKPGNVMVRPARRGAVLLDLGMAWAPEVSRLTLSGDLLGTPCYHPPELLRGGAWSPASDVFQFGATLFFALTGRPHVRGEELLEIRARIAQGQWSPLPDRTPRPLAALVTRCLSTDPGARPPDGAALEEELSRVHWHQASRSSEATLEPIPAGGRPRRSKTSRFLDLRPALTGMVAGLALGMTTAVMARAGAVMSLVTSPPPRAPASSRPASPAPLATAGDFRGRMHAQTDSLLDGRAAGTAPPGTPGELFRGLPPWRDPDWIRLLGGETGRGKRVRYHELACWTGNPQDEGRLGRPTEIPLRWPMIPEDAGLVALSLHLEGAGDRFLLEVSSGRPAPAFPLRIVAPRHRERPGWRSLCIPASLCPPPGSRITVRLLPSGPADIGYVRVRDVLVSWQPSANPAIPAA